MGRALARRRERVGKYEIIRRLATGGMAELHLACARGPRGLDGFEKLVVIKRILPQLAGDPEFVRMFLDEARLAALLDHGNLVHVFDVGATGQSYYLAMEYLHGEDVRHVTRAAEQQRRPLGLDEVLTIVTAVAAGLHYAHEKRGPKGEALELVHRDVSPQNIIVTYDGGVKLVDFGIAKAANRVSDTRTGTIKGKLQYMSPEQCIAAELDRRSDVFSLAVLLWELLTGKRLFDRANDLAVLKAIVENDAPAPSTVKPSLPPRLDAIVMRGLARDREARYDTAEELQSDLERFARAEQLALSQLTLTRCMRDLFGDKPLPTERNITAATRALVASPRSRAPLWIAGGVGVVLAAGAAGLAIHARRVKRAVDERPVATVAPRATPPIAPQATVQAPPPSAPQPTPPIAPQATSPIAPQAAPPSAPQAAPPIAPRATPAIAPPRAPTPPRHKESHGAKHRSAPAQWDLDSVDLPPTRTR
jgi:serine/threonine protein kinase